jgi:hypothetical protein
MRGAVRSLGRVRERGRFGGWVRATERTVGGVAKRGEAERQKGKKEKKKEKGRKGAKRPGVKPEREKKNPVWGDGEVQRERTEMGGIK